MMHLFAIGHGGTLKDYLLPEEAARELRVTAKTVRRWCKLGMIKADRAGRGWRISRAALDAFVKQQKEIKPEEHASGLVEATTRPAGALVAQPGY